MQSDSKVVAVRWLWAIAVVGIVWLSLSNALVNDSSVTHQELGQQNVNFTQRNLDNATRANQPDSSLNSSFSINHLSLNANISLTNNCTPLKPYNKCTNGSTLTSTSTGSTPHSIPRFSVRVDQATKKPVNSSNFFHIKKHDMKFYEDRGFIYLPVYSGPYSGPYRTTTVSSLTTEGQQTMPTCSTTRPRPRFSVRGGRKKRWIERRPGSPFNINLNTTRSASIIISNLTTDDFSGGIDFINEPRFLAIPVKGPDGGEIVRAFYRKFGLKILDKRSVSPSSESWNRLPTDPMEEQTEATTSTSPRSAVVDEPNISVGPTNPMPEQTDEEKSTFPSASVDIPSKLQDQVHYPDAKLPPQAGELPVNHSKPDVETGDNHHYDWVCFFLIVLVFNFLALGITFLCLYRQETKMTNQVL